MEQNKPINYKMPKEVLPYLMATLTASGFKVDEPKDKMGGVQIPGLEKRKITREGVDYNSFITSYSSQSTANFHIELGDSELLSLDARLKDRFN